MSIPNIIFLCFLNYFRYRIN